MSDILWVLIGIISVLAYATIGVISGKVVMEKSLAKCEDDHEGYKSRRTKNGSEHYCEHDVRGEFFGVFWGVALPGVLIGIVVGTGVKFLARGPKVWGLYVANAILDKTGEKDV